MAIHKTGTPDSLKAFISSGKILLVNDLTDGSFTNLGACFDAAVNDKGMAWACSYLSEVQAELIREIRIMEGEDFRHYEVEFDSKSDLVLVIRGPMGPEEEDEIKSWKKLRDQDGIKAQLPESLDMLDSMSSPGKPSDKYYFSFWTIFTPGLGLYPVGVVVASGARLVFLGLQGRELEADSWQRSHGNRVTGNPRKDLEELSKVGLQTSFSSPEPLLAHDMVDAIERAMGRAKKSKDRIDQAAKFALAV